MQIDTETQNNLTIKEIETKILQVQLSFRAFTDSFLPLMHNNNHSNNFNEIINSCEEATNLPKVQEEKSFLPFLKRERNTQIPPEELKEISRRFNNIIEVANESKLTLEIDIKLYEELLKELIKYYKQIECLLPLLSNKITELKNQNQVVDTNDIEGNPTMKEIDRLEKKLQDYMMSKQVIGQYIGQIKMIITCNNDILAQIDKILLHTIPLLNLEIAINIGIEKQSLVLRTEKSISSTSTSSLQQLSSNIENNNKLLNDPKKVKEAMKEIRDCIVPIKEAIEQEKEEKGIVLTLTKSQGDNNE